MDTGWVIYGLFLIVGAFTRVRPGQGSPPDRNPDARRPLRRRGLAHAGSAGSDGDCHEVADEHDALRAEGVECDQAVVDVGVGALEDADELGHALLRSSLATTQPHRATPPPTPPEAQVAN
ncbi:hypothetical protein [Streptomyces sp. NPDC003487]